MCSTHPPTISVKYILKEVVALTAKLQCLQNINDTKWKIQLEINSLSSSKLSLFYGFKRYSFIEHIGVCFTFSNTLNSKRIPETWMNE